MKATIASAPAGFQRGGSVLHACYNTRFPGRDRGVRAPIPANSISFQWKPVGKELRAGAIRSLKLAGPAGRLEAILNEGSADARFAALICHPHPLGGGNLHNKVVYHAMKVLNDGAWGFGCPVLRFNFRGAGLSDGAHHGQAESGDVVAAMDWLGRAFRLPLIVAGFSFGAAMAARACSEPGAPQRDIRALIALGLPTADSGRDYQYSFLKNLTVPKLFVSGARDCFAPIAQLTEVVATASDPKCLLLIPAADHFFTGQLEPMQRALAGWLKEQLP